MPKEDFRREVEKELTGKEVEPSELIYFKVHKGQISVIEQAIEMAALMLGSDKSRGYCLEMICADFLAGASLDNQNPEMMVLSMVRAGRDSIRVLVADSNQTQSQLLSSALRRQPGMKVTCCRGELSDCIQALRSASVDVILLGDGPTDHDHLIDTLQALHTSYPEIGLILLLDSYDRNLVVSAMRAGTRGLFCRACQPFRALCRCISVVYQGQFWANTEQVGYVIEALSSAPRARVINAKGEGLLTPREEEVVGLVAEGIGNREVAQQLGIKENTVKKALLRIYDKLGVSNRVELVLYALTHRGVETHPSTPAKRPPAPEGLALDCVKRGNVNLLGADCGCIPKAN